MTLFEPAPTAAPGPAAGAGAGVVVAGLAACPVVELADGRPCGAPATRRLLLSCPAGHAGAAEVCPQHEHDVLDAGEVLVCLRCRRDGAAVDLSAWPP